MYIYNVKTNYTITEHIAYSISTLLLVVVCGIVCWGLITLAFCL